MAQLAQRSTATGARRSAQPLHVFARVASDLALILLGFWLAYLLRYRGELGGDITTEINLPFDVFREVMLVFAATLLTVFAIRGAYRLPRWTGFLDEALLIAGSTIVGLSAIIVFYSFYEPEIFISRSRLVLLYAVVIVTTLLLVKRLIQRLFGAWMRSRGRWIDRVLVVGAGPAGERVMGALIEQPQLGYEVVGFVEDAPPRADWAIATQRVIRRPAHLGACHELPEVIRRQEIDEVIVALPAAANDQLHWVIEQCRAQRVPFTLLPDLFELSLDRVNIHDLNGLPLISVRDAGIRGWNYALKRASDVVLASLALMIGIWPMAIIALLIRLDSPGPILYGQRRVGKSGEPFTFYKFRSMYVDADRDKERLLTSASYSGDRVLFKMKDDPRRTRIGRWLRRTSLDELPNVFNVLRGEMSIVGPRPHLPQEVAQYEPWQRQRLAITPGITCLWQVNGRSNLTFDEQVQFDLYYAEHWSLWLDIKIILRTIPAVLTGRGAY